MSVHQHAVFFEASDLSNDDMVTIRKYFQIRRRSGGGDCGEVEKMRENTYKIAFREQTDQERVLSKTEHTVPLARQRSLHILLRRHDEQEDKKKQPSSSTDQQMASGGKPMETALKLDPYLLQFLKESAAASLDLEKHLAFLSSSYKLDLVSEKVIVIRDQVESAEDDVAQKWEAKVEKLFSDLQARYLIHFEVEPERLMILKQNPFPPSEYLKIYKEGGLTVIVGENMEMEKFLKIMDALQLQQQACKEYPVAETQYTLVKEQFEQEMKSNFSGIKITKDRPDSVALKGPEEQVQAAGKKLQALVNQIQEKRIQLHPALTAFLSSSGAVQKYQTRFRQSLRRPVLLETRGSDLVLLSLSTGALQEAATAVQRDVCVESVPLERAEAGPPGIDTLKEALRQALQQANSGTTNVEVTYEPGTNVDPRMKVQLVGYNTEVSTLKIVIQDYKENHAEYSDTLPLPLPEMVDNFSDLLALVVVKTGDVNLVASHLPGPCIRLSGPRREVKDIKEKLSSAIGCLVWDKIEVDGPGVVQFFQGDGLKTQSLVQNSFQVLIIPEYNARSSPTAAGRRAWTSLPNLSSAVSTPQTPADSSLALEIVFGGLEEQQADVLVVPMLKTTLNSTKVGTCLLDKAGQQLKTNFNTAKGRRRITPGDVLEVDGTPLGCSKVFFIECVPWSGNTDDGERALRYGLERALSLSEQQGWSSIAMPVIGPGPALSVPVKDASSILTEIISTFGRSGFSGTIRIAIMPNYANSEEIYQAVFTGLSAQMVDQTGQAVFQSLSSEIDEITIPAGRCQLHLVFGDISNEITDVVVNTTDFNDFHTDVCNDILTVAGPQVQAALTGVRVNKGEIFTTQPGNFPCKELMHVCGEKDTGVIKGLARDIVSKCESDGCQSVAIPAICAGKGGLEARLVAQSILQGVKDAVRGANFRYLKTIRIVILKINVFLAFKEVALQLFGTFTQTTAPALLRPFRAASRGHQPPSMAIDLSSLVQALPVQQRSRAEFLVIGSTAENVSYACQELRRAYERECSSQSFSADELRHLAQDEFHRITSNVDSLGIQITQRSPNDLVVCGLTSGVNEIARMMQGALLRQVRESEQDIIFAHVSWCILGSRGDWERLPKKAHHQLENNNFAAGVMDAQGRMWAVNLTRMEASAIAVPSTVAKLKRLENLSDFSFPLYWDSMDPGETLKLVTLPSSSAEYKRVKADFKRTVQKTVLKIERIQNVHLRRAYEVRKKELQDKNGFPVGAGEKVLYHGSTGVACSSIQRTNFDRRFAGQNATRFGLGTYFAVNASYSAHPTFSVPAADGTQLMFVVLVLTGHYAQGQSNMNTPPPRSSQDPNDRCDSVVDNMQNPEMFVVFHDCQAYPDYLITFK
ncbi:protein mono-ADP-ribosyltransferase PARP14-like [Colossoma macropomum]|uniref:protein mono-ADP-ribosyltransferase PARP14-like n=1 Tax=Colossoma macropomum TaxID=42526 RepID=UPI001863B531|nr:protein mono-ADP-ribosyltransferase PARP14-like [Colossoma macropomum]